MLERTVRSALSDVATLLDLPVEVDRIETDGLDSVTVHGLIVGGDADDTPLLTVERVHVAIDSVSITDRTARLADVTVEKPEITLIHRADGTDNYSAVRDVVRRFFLRDGAVSNEDKNSSQRLWDRLQRHVPRLHVVDGQVHVVDESGDRRVIPRLLPKRLSLTGVTVEGENTSKLSDVMLLNVSMSARLPAWDTGVKSTFRLDRERSIVHLMVRLTDPISSTVAGHEVALRTAEWETGGDVRLLGVRVGEQFSAQEVVITPTANPSATRPMESIQRVLLVRPVIHVGEGFFTPTSSGSAAIAAKMDGKPSSPWTGTAKRPKRVKEKGDKARQWMRTLYLGVAQHLERFLSRIVDRVGAARVPEIIVRRGRVSGQGEDALTVLAALTGEFSGSINRPDDDMVEVDLKVARPKDDGFAGQATARIQPGTGDVQVTFQADGLDLYPYRSLLPTRMNVTESTTLDATNLRLVWSAAARRVEVDGDWKIEQVGLTAPALASKPMTGIDVAGDVRATVDLKTASVVLSPSTFQLGSVPITVSLQGEDLANAPRMTLELDLPAVETQHIVDSLPPEFIPRLEGLKMSGTLSWEWKGTLDTRDMRSLQYTSRVKPKLVQVKDMGKHISFKAINRPFTHRVQRTDGEMFEFVTGPGSRGWVSLDETSPYMDKVLTTTEDGTFWTHDGIAFFALKDSLINNLERGRYFRGGSTITMQLVKNLLLTQEKTLSRKVQELFLSWQIDRHLTKQRILELYLNIVEFGPGKYGLGRAAQYYFAKTPAELNLLECAFLASLLPNPRRYHRQFARGRVTKGWQAGLRRILKLMLKRDKITTEEYEAMAPYSPLFRGSKPEIVLPEDGATPPSVAPNRLERDPNTPLVPAGPAIEIEEQEFPAEAPVPQP